MAGNVQYRPVMKAMSVIILRCQRGACAVAARINVQWPYYHIPSSVIWLLACNIVPLSVMQSIPSIYCNTMTNHHQ